MIDHKTASSAKQPERRRWLTPIKEFGSEAAAGGLTPVKARPRSRSYDGDVESETPCSAGARMTHADFKARAQPRAATPSTRRDDGAEAPPAGLQARLVAALADPSRFASASRVETIETHISYVLLTGVRAYKIKKAVAFGFLDFTTLDRRKFYCEEELRLNRRLAPALYLDVVPIGGSVDDPRIGVEPAIEYAVEMQEFTQDALASNVLARGELAPHDIDRLAASVAQFHRTAQRAAAEGPLGAPKQVLELALANFAEIVDLGLEVDEAQGLRALESWTRSEHARRRPAFAARLADGFVRECHGDLHLGNIAMIEGRLVPFDCIEFNDAMRWIDVMSETAFTVMDLEHRGRPDLARRFVDRWLEETGDYQGLAVLRFYLVYRALVRAKVASLRAGTGARADARDEALRELRGYVRVALDCTAPARPAVVVMHGLAGCGKTTLTQAMLEGMDAIRIRSDVERKRLTGLRAEESSRSGLGRDLYATGMTQQTYDAMAGLARAVVDAGSIALIDATFLQRWQREMFRRLAASLAVPFIVVDIRAPESVLRERVERRARAGGDASEANIAVLDLQLRTQDPLEPDESADVVGFDGGLPLDGDEAEDARRRLFDQIRDAVRAR
jgi:aminoglycoside phosphotransferase family enzyme/predicted kinase